MCRTLSTIQITPHHYFLLNSSDLAQDRIHENIIQQIFLRSFSLYESHLRRPLYLHGHMTGHIVIVAFDKTST